MYNRRMKDNFERHAHTYDRHATVQAEMARLLCKAIEKTGRTFFTIQEAGCGTGIFSRLMLDAFHPRFIRLSDISLSMLNLARTRCPVLPDVRLEFVEGDVEQLDLGRDFDLFAANAVFQWVRNLRPLYPASRHHSPYRACWPSTFLCPGHFTNWRRRSGAPRIYRRLL